MTEKMKRVVRTPQPKSDLQFIAHAEFVALAKIDDVLNELPPGSASKVLETCRVATNARVAEWLKGLSGPLEGPQQPA